jgi:hypothetical protein
MAFLVYPFLGLAAGGFIVVLIVHAAALLGVVHPFEVSAKFLFPGLIVVWLPTILVMTRLTRDFNQKDIWRAALRGCPKWLQRAQWILFGYTWVGFFALPIIYGGGMDLPINKARSMSSVLLAFYSIAASVLYSATQATKLDEGKYCLNGHRVSPLAKYCDECGAPVQAAPSQSARTAR